MTDTPETLDLGDGIKLTPVNPTAAAIYGVLRTLIASAGLIVAIWRYVSAGQLIEAYQFVTSPTNAGAIAGLLGALAAAGSMAWGFWKKRKGKKTENALKAAVVASAVTQTPVSPAILPTKGATP